MTEINTKPDNFKSDWKDYKNTPKYQHRKPMGLMKGFIISCVWAAFMGFVIGCVLTAIRTGHFLP